MCFLAVVRCVRGKSVTLVTQRLSLTPVCFSYGAPLAPVLSSYTPEASDLQVGSLVLIISLYNNVGAHWAISSPSKKNLFLEAYPIQTLSIIYVEVVLLETKSARLGLDCSQIVLVIVAKTYVFS